MTSEAGRVLRLLRALALTGVVTVLGTVAHTLAGGRLPGVTGFAVLILLLVAGTSPLLARAASTGRIVLLVIAGQTLVHTALTASAGHAGDGVRPDPVQHTAPVIPESVLSGTRRVGTLADQLHPQVAGGPGEQLAVPDWALHLLADLQPAQLPMALTHLLAAAGVGLWLASGERALFALLALAAAPALLLLLPAALPVHPARPRMPRPLLLPVVRIELLLRSCLARRGPPVLVLAC